MAAPARGSRTAPLGARAAPRPSTAVACAGARLRTARTPALAAAHASARLELRRDRRGFRWRAGNGIQDHRRPAGSARRRGPLPLPPDRQRKHRGVLQAGHAALRAGPDANGVRRLWRPLRGERRGRRYRALRSDCRSLAGDAARHRRPEQRPVPGVHRRLARPRPHRELRALLVFVSVLQRLP